MNKDIVNFVFNYLKENKEFTDKEELAVVGLLPDKELEAQEKFDIFVFAVLKECIKLAKFYSDDDDCYENYTFYLKYKELKITVYVLYGMGNFFDVTTDTTNYREYLEVDLEKLI